MFIVGKEGVQEKWYSIKTLVADLQCVPRKGFGSASSPDSDNICIQYMYIYLSIHKQRIRGLQNAFRGTHCIIIVDVVWQHVVVRGLKEEAVLEILHREFSLNPGTQIILALQLL